MFFPFDTLTNLFNTTIAGLPAFVIAIIPFIVGLIVGFLLKKVLKWAIIIGAIIIIIALFGFFGLSIGALESMAATYLPILFTYGVLLLGLMPLGVGFIIGAIIGFIFS